MKLTDMEIKKFQKKVYSYYKKHGRTLPWRDIDNPYGILISEIMLQQTQVDRVVEKYYQFMRAFPDTNSLARAPLSHLLAVWQGLGYNRRALFLQKTAKKIVENYDGKIPSDEEELATLPGIGTATAASIAAFAFNKPVVFIETNVRSVFIHHFFSTQKVTDKEIHLLVTQTLDKKNPRKWYTALMDYGTMLKKQYMNPSRNSTHYKKQTPFEGSNRQVRGTILKILTTTNTLSLTELVQKVNHPSVEKNLLQLEKEGFLIKKGKKIMVRR